MKVRENLNTKIDKLPLVILGTIGSAYKIDASYLAPDVNMAARLEAATKQFGVSLLMSHGFFNCLSSRIKTFVRCVDCVLVKGSTNPTALYTFDCAPLSPLSVFHGIMDLPTLQAGLPRTFLDTYKEGLDAYLKGTSNFASISEN